MKTHRQNGEVTDGENKSFTEQQVGTVEGGN
jgi:hypothetical protein